MTIAVEQDVKLCDLNHQVQIINILRCLGKKLWHFMSHVSGYRIMDFCFSVSCAWSLSLDAD